MVQLLVICAALALTACGGSKGEVVKAHDVSTWAGSATLQANKQTVVAALKQAGADDKRVALVMAAFMLETNDGTCAERDATKSGDAENFSAFNMNAFALRKLGWSKDAGPDLNQDAHLGDAAKLFNHGLDFLGEDRWLNLHRGGEAAFNDGVSYGCADYRSAIRATQDKLISDPSLITNGARVGASVPHV